MNLYIQLFIPLVLTLIIISVIALVRKYFRADAVILCTALIALSIATGIPGFRMLIGEIKDNAPAIDSADSPSVISANEEDYLTIAGRYIADGNIAEAKMILNELKKGDASSSQVILMSARISALEGDWKKAIQLYKTAQAIAAASGKDKDFPDDELENALALSESTSNSGNAAIESYIKSTGAYPASYGITPANDNKKDESDACRTITDRINDSIDEKQDSESDDRRGIASCAEYASALTEEFEKYLDDGSFENETVKKQLKRLKLAMNESTALAANKYLRTAYIKGLILMRDYAEIAGLADGSSGTEELIIIAELYIDGYIKDKDFKSDYVKSQSTALEAVVDRCRSIMDGELSDASKQVRKSYKEKIAMLEGLRDSNAIGTIRRDLRAHASSRNDNITSKAYLELAKIEKYLGNDTLSDEYITEALGTASLSTDDNYSAPMTSLLGIIEGSSSGGTEDLKKVAEFVSEAVDNSLPYDLTAAAIAAAPPVSSGDGGQQDNGNQSGADSNDNSTSADSGETFTQYMTSSVSQKTAVVNIGVIDKSRFPEISARIQVNSSKIADPEDMLKYLRVFDCNSKITEFDVEKIDFDTSRIILLCDVSGSMSGSVGALKDAITRFADEMNENEKISVIGFDDSINFERDFSSDPQKIASYADDIGAYGGTDMFSALKYALGKFPSDINANNIVILMTDGEDNNPKGEATIRNDIGALCADNSATVYTLGLGSSVDTAYLKLIADAGNGSFLYVDSDAGLDNFYDFIHQQLTSQYVLKYRAKNLTMENRLLNISVKDELGSAEKVYYLHDPEYSDGSNDAYVPYVVENSDIKFYGLSTKFLYRSSKDQTVNLKGEGFDAGEEITLKITGSVSCLLDAKYVDANTYSVTVPASVATGEYNMEISVRGQSFTLKKELTVAVPGTEKVFKYGSYEFTALKSYKDSSGATVLSGNVTMNGWLRFKGDVTVTGEYLDSGKVTLRDDSGAYVAYSSGNSRGLAKYMADKGINLPIAPLGDFTLYVQKYSAGDYESFPVQKVDLISEFNIFFLVSENFGISIYPDCAKIQGLNFSYSLPFQKQLLRNFPDKMDTFAKESGKADTEMMIGATDIGLIVNFEYKDLKAGKTDFSMVALPLKLASIKIDIDTLSNNYSLEGDVSIKALKDMDSFSFEFGIKDGRFDSIGLGVGGKINVPIMKAPVPITVSDFGFELSGFSKYESSESTLSNLLGTTIAFKFQVNVGDISSTIPGLNKLISDDPIAAATLKNCKLSATLKTFTFKFEADAYLFTVLDIGHCELEAGSFSYSNELINLGGDKVYGIRAAVTLGSTWDTVNCYVKMTGTAEVVLGYPYTGLWLDGDLDFNVGWWILRADWDVSGDFLIAFYKNSSDKAQFSMIVRGTNSKGKYSGFHLYITPETGMDIYKY